MPKFIRAEFGADRYGWFVLFITADAATPNFRSAMPDEPTARQTAAGFQAVPICTEIIRRAAPGSAARHEFANGRGTLAGVSLSADDVRQASRVCELAGLPHEYITDRFPAKAE